MFSKTQKIQSFKSIVEMKEKLLTKNHRKVVTLTPPPSIKNEEYEILFLQLLLLVLCFNVLK